MEGFGEPSPAKPFQAGFQSLANVRDTGLVTTSDVAHAGFVTLANNNMADSLE